MNIQSELGTINTETNLTSRKEVLSDETRAYLDTPPSYDEVVFMTLEEGKKYCSDEIFSELTEGTNISNKSLDNEVIFKATDGTNISNKPSAYTISYTPRNDELTFEETQIEQRRMDDSIRDNLQIKYFISERFLCNKIYFQLLPLDSPITEFTHLISRRYKLYDHLRKKTINLTSVPKNPAFKIKSKNSSKFSGMKMKSNILILKNLEENRKPGILAKFDEEILKSNIYEKYIQCKDSVDTMYITIWKDKNKFEKMYESKIVCYQRNDKVLSNEFVFEVVPSSSCMAKYIHSKNKTFKVRDWKKKTFKFTPINKIELSGNGKFTSVSETGAKENNENEIVGERLEISEPLEAMKIRIEFKGRINRNFYTSKDLDKNIIYKLKSKIEQDYQSFIQIDYEINSLLNCTLIFSICSFICFPLLSISYCIVLYIAKTQVRKGNLDAFNKLKIFNYIYYVLFFIIIFFFSCIFLPFLHIFIKL